MTAERVGEEDPRQVPGTDKGEVFDQLLVSDDVATDLLPYQVEEEARLSQARDPAVLDMPNTAMYNAAMQTRVKFISDE
jgi:hypothetical protein